MFKGNLFPIKNRSFELEVFTCDRTTNIIHNLKILTIGRLLIKNNQ